MLATREHMAAEEVRTIRHQLGFTQQRFANAIGVSIRTVRSWEQDRGWPNLENEERIRRLAEPDNVRMETMRRVLIEAMTIADENAKIACELGNTKDMNRYRRFANGLYDLIVGLD